MGFIKGASREQVTLMPDCLDDYVSAENVVRVIDAFVWSLDVAALGFKAQAAQEGRPGYDPRDMLKLYIYGYQNKIRSSRRLQKEAGRNVELMWLLGKIVPDFRCISDFRKDNADAIKKVFREFVSLCDKAGLLSHEAVVIDGSKFRAVNSDNNCFVKVNVEKLIAQADERIVQYMAELDAADSADRRAEELTAEDIRGVLEYLSKRKAQLETALTNLNDSDLNHVCTTDPECRLMKTRDGCKPAFNVQTAVEPNNHIITHFDVTSECTDWNLLADGIAGAKEAVGEETLEGIADKGYGCDDAILECLLSGDTPTIYPNKGQNCRTFKFDKTDDEITPEMTASDDHEILKKCLAAGVLPEVLRRGDVTLEVKEITVPTPGEFLNKATGEIVSFDEMKAAGGTERQQVETRRELPLSPYFERNIEADTVTCPMGQTFLYEGPNYHGGKKYDEIRRYHRLSVCQKCPNKCTASKKRVVSFKTGETRIYTDFYDKCMAGLLTQKANNAFVRLKTKPLKKKVVVLRFYPNQHRLRCRNQIVEHPYGTVKRWNDGYYLLVKGKVKAAAEMALSFLGYNMKRAINALGPGQLMALINA
jgi:transposase